MSTPGVKLCTEPWISKLSSDSSPSSRSIRVAIKLSPSSYASTSRKSPTLISERLSLCVDFVSSSKSVLVVTVTTTDDAPVANVSVLASRSIALTVASNSTRPRRSLTSLALRIAPSQLPSASTTSPACILSVEGCSSAALASTLMPLIRKLSIPT